MLMEVEDIGDKIALSIMNYFRNEQNLELLDKLSGQGLNFTQDLELQSEAFAGMNFVISGSFEDHSREELKALIEANGGKVGSSISARTSYLLGGSNIGPSKLKKVQELGIPRISESELIKMLK